MTEHHVTLTSEGELYPSPARAIEYPDLGPPAAGRAITLGAGLQWARMPLPMELNHINVWLLADGDGWTLVDTGLAHDDSREAWQGLETQELGGRPLRRIVVTHDHPDHMGLARWLHERHGAPVWMSAIAHRSIAEYLAMAHDDLLSARLAFLTAHGMDIGPDGLRRLSGTEHGAWFGGLPPLGRPTQGGDSIDVDGRTLEVIETSGHCRGHLCLYDARNAILISGDQVLPTISPNVSVLASRPDANPLREFLDSLARLEQCAPETLVLPSHGRPFHGLHRRIEVLRAHHLEELDQLHGACREPRTAFDLLPVMFGRPLRGYHRLLALGEAVAHLNHLWHDGRVTREVEASGRILFRAA
jgi:glyoxylase-like metal-dependent hydrolase (beta-lactamase superfamily II)